MSMNYDNTTLTNIIDGVIKEVVEDYTINEWRYLTENDIVCTVFSKLEERLDNDIPCKSEGSRFFVHTELRPYIDGKSVLVLKEGTDGQFIWAEQNKENDSGRFDLVIIRGNNGFQEAKKKASEAQWKESDHGDLKYARILSYPLLSFEAIIEVKIRVRGNKRRIMGDLRKLELIKEKHPNCIARMVILDRYATKNSPENVKEIIDREKDVEKAIGCFNSFG